MIVLPPRGHEASRVDMVRSFDLLDQPRSPQHDEITALARKLSRAEWALVTLIDSERVWFSGAANYGNVDGCRWNSFCTHVVDEPNEVLWVEDARQDFRFSRLPHVRNSPHIRFYAGAPVRVNGYTVGAFCVFDRQARVFDPQLASLLSSLATVVSEDLSLRHRLHATKASLAASADALIDCDAFGHILCWNHGAERLFGVPSAEALGRTIDIIVPPGKKDAANRGFHRWCNSGARTTGRKFEMKACRTNGSLVDIELWMSVAHVRGEKLIHGHIRDISERKAHAHALETARNSAQAANEAKSTFLANMSHELRTPLNGVIGAVDLLGHTSLSDRQRELTSLIERSSRHLAGLVSDVLDLGRIESGKLVLSNSDVSLPDVLEIVRTVCEPAAQDKGIVLSVDFDPAATLPVIGDSLRITQVLSNLVSNAIKFTERGSVSISVSRNGDDYRFEVADTGIGFSEKQQANIFGRFHQADASITRRFGGAGLGLAISRDLISAMGGDIDCYSEPGQGARFWVTLRLPKTAQPPATDVQLAVAPPRIGRVLVVDDNPTNRRVAQLVLEAIGIEVASVEDGEQAVAAFIVAKFDVILMDMMMPVMDGLAATTAIRDIELQNSLSPTPIIMLTTNNLPQHVEASLNAGADLHLPKPLSVAALVEALSKMPRSTSCQHEGDRRADFLSVS